jgi:hypothetical protein
MNVIVIFINNLEEPARFVRNRRSQCSKLRRQARTPRPRPTQITREDHNPLMRPAATVEHAPESAMIRQGSRLMVSLDRASDSG